VPNLNNPSPWLEYCTGNIARGNAPFYGAMPPDDKRMGTYGTVQRIFAFNGPAPHLIFSPTPYTETHVSGQTVGGIHQSVEPTMRLANKGTKKKEKITTPSSNPNKPRWYIGGCSRNVRCMSWAKGGNNETDPP
jgi:hypothetical protein